MRIIDVLGGKEANQEKENRNMKMKRSISLCQLYELYTA